jgi:hypothetical protein
MKLKVKEKYRGMIVTRNVPEIGNAIFDPYIIDPEDYINYYNLGFDHLFEEIIEIKNNKENERQGTINKRKQTGHKTTKEKKS